MAAMAVDVKPKRSSCSDTFWQAAALPELRPAELRLLQCFHYFRFYNFATSSLHSGRSLSPRAAREAMTARRCRQQHPRARMSSGDLFTIRCGLEAPQALALLV